ncbi:HAD-like protein [Lactarius psammicola]|nr:HAD-like protein [Lactarius psammicola]
MTWEIKAGLMGKPERASAAHLLSFFPDIPLTIDEYLARRTAAQDAHFPHVQLLPGVARLVAHLAAHSVPIAIATSSRRRNYERKTAHLQHVFGHFGEHVVCGDDGAGRGKPFPDVFLAAARALGRAVGPNEGDGTAGAGEAERAERARGLVFEDAIPGVQAGKRAGMSVVWVPDENLFSVGYSQAVEQPDQTLRSLERFVPEEWSLPPFTTTEKPETSV